MDNSKETEKLLIAMEKVGIEDVPLVGGKNASLGEMLKHLLPKGVRIPTGFIVTAEAYRYFLDKAGLVDVIKNTLEGLNTSDITDLTDRAKKVRDAIIKAEFPEDLNKLIVEAYQTMEQQYGKNIDVAVRSSATAEDLPGASFAGEHETYLGIRGTKDVLTAARAAMASLFTARAISYRVDKKFDHFKAALSVSIQRMVRSDKGASGVMFTLDTESGFKDTIVINTSYGLGEMVVLGEVNPDEYLVAKKKLGIAPKPIIYKKAGDKLAKMIYSDAKAGIRPVKIVKTTKAEQQKFVLTDDEIIELAKWGVLIEEHYSTKNNKWMPMDIEWAKDGKTNELYIVQARPETIHAGRDFSKLKEYVRKEDGEALASGVSVGSKIATGKARVILDVKNITDFKKGEVLVTDMTDPDWEPIMKIASAIVTDKGGRTSHAAIVSRELGIPAIVGTGNATRKIKTGDDLTVDTMGESGVAYKGTLKFEIIEHDLKTIPTIKTKIMMNIGTPDTAFEKSFLPNSGVGLAREEFIIASGIGVHPMALINYKSMTPKLKKKIDSKIKGAWTDKTEFYIDNLAFGIAKIATAFYPNPVIVRFSDFKTNEYCTLIGGDIYEPKEENPMIGWRGASRYYDDKFKEAFKLECLAIKKIRNEMGLENVIPMVPFCRTPEEGMKTLEILGDAGVITKYYAKKHNLPADKTVPVYVMCEIPSNILLADEFLDIFDGMSIGSNDLTQLVLGLDRDSGIVSHVANELNESVKKMVSEIIKICTAKGKYIGICGQAPSDHPDFARFLIKAGIQTMSLNPDSVIKTIVAISEEEIKLQNENRNGSGKASPDLGSAVQKAVSASEEEKKLKTDNS
ncbi:MAG: phosphoenolpyruvate synthase [Candidatus Paceibacterota bacterium]